MNIISNACFSGRYYQHKHVEFNNPFIWNQILPNDFIYLISNYQTINFANYNISPSNFFVRNGNKPKTPKYIYKVTVDNKIDAHFVHYRYDKNAHTPKIMGVDVYYSKIAEYVEAKYQARLARMMQCSETPNFIITASEPEWTISIQQAVCNLVTPYKIILFSDYPDKLITGHENILIKKLIRPIGNCDNMVNQYGELVSKFFFEHSG